PGEASPPPPPLALPPPQPRQLRPLILAQHPAAIAAAALVGVHPVAQGARVDSQIPGHLRDRLPGLPDQPDRALPEISVELPACLCHRRTPLSFRWPLRVAPGDENGGAHVVR